jgi:hypothetical protein
MSDSNSETARESIFGFILIVVVGLIIFSLFRTPKPFDIAGLWRGDGEYLFVEESEEEFKSRYTGIAPLRFENWKRKTNPHSIEVFNKRDEKKATILLLPDNEYFPDEMKVVTASGDKYHLKIDEKEEWSFFKSMASYSRNYLFGGVIYPDGIYRLIILYLFASLFGVFFGLHLFKDWEFKPWVKITAPVVAWLAPFFIGYILGIFKWIILGWWDPLFLGKSIVNLEMVMLIAPLFLLLFIVKSLKEEIFRKKQRKLQVYLYLFLVSDVIGVVFNIKMCVELLF